MTLLCKCMRFGCTKTHASDMIMDDAEPTAGPVTVMRVEGHPVVTRAALVIEMTGELWDQLGAAPGETVSFGTAGKGLGVVTYRQESYDLPADLHTLRRVIT